MAWPVSRGASGSTGWLNAGRCVWVIPLPLPGDRRSPTARIVSTSPTEEIVSIAPEVHGADRMAGCVTSTRRACACCRSAAFVAPGTDAWAAAMRTAAVGGMSRHWPRLGQHLESQGARRRDRLHEPNLDGVAETEAAPAAITDQRVRFLY